MSMAPEATRDLPLSPPSGVECAVPLPATDGLTRRVRRALHARLQRLHGGTLTIDDPLGCQRLGSEATSEVPGMEPLHAHVTVRNPDFYLAVAGGGALGAAEAWMRGEWESTDLTAALRLLVRNREVMEGLESGWARCSRPLLLAWHALRRNTRRGSRRNIAAHYDLGNDFFRLMLDETMMYSAAIFERPGMSLAEAQAARLERICRKLELRPEHHLLEIGTGWGAMALHAAREYGCRVTTTTISREQYALARARVAEAGLADRVTVLLSDYRELTGEYDKLVSLEMIEAVGHHYYPGFFDVCMRRLKPNGTLLLQAIVIRDHFYARALRRVDFIQRHIFPGATIPSISALCGAAAAHSDLVLNHLEDLTAHYAETLRHWRRNFHVNQQAIRDLGYSATFRRMWDYYLCYCEAGFEERQLGDVQMTFSRPLNRSTHPMGHI